MRQLFTVPQMKGEKRNRFLSKAPYAVCLLPVLVYIALVGYDILTVVILLRYKQGFQGKSLWQVLTESPMLWLMVIEGLCAMIIIQITLRCLERQHYLYFIWDSYWKLLDPKKDNLCLLEPDVAVHFRQGENVDLDEINKILREEEIAREANKLSLLRRFWRGFKEENSPIMQFLFAKRKAIGEPCLINIDPALTALYSNDKQINDTLRKNLEQRKKQEKQTDDSIVTSDEK